MLCHPSPTAGKRDVYFEVNGVPRVVEVVDRSAEAAVSRKAVREKADLAVLGSVGAPMAGTIVEVQVSGQADSSRVEAFTVLTTPPFAPGFSRPPL